MDMRRNKKKWKGFSILIAAALSVGTLVGSFTAYGAQAEAHPDLTRKGSVSIAMVDKTTNSPVSGGEMSLFRVAKVAREDWNDSFVYTEEFTDCMLLLDDPGSEELAKGLADFAEEKKINGDKKKIGSDGTVKYTDLEVGLYLLVQSTAAKGYEAVTPFLVTVPIMVNGELIYDVDAAPKTSGVIKGAAEPSKSHDSSDDDDDDDNDNDDPGIKVKGIQDEVSDPGTAQTDVITDGPDTPAENLTLQVLPKTGQLWWPVPVLAAVGGILLLIGWLEKKKA